MFESFSAKYESGFRTFFTVWVGFWTFINILELLFTYASFSSNNNQGQWLFDILGLVVSLSAGIMLLFYMNSLASIIKKRKHISGIGLWVALTVFYYLSTNLFTLIGYALFNPDELSSQLVFIIGWLLPSIVILILHIIYFLNISKYKEQLEEGTLEKE